MTKRTPTLRLAGKIPSIRGVVTIVSCSLAGGVMGQSILAPLPTIPGQVPTGPADNPGAAGISTGAAAGTGPIPQGAAATVPGSAEAQAFLSWGDVHVRTHLDYQFLYGTGVQSAPGQPNSTITQTVSPGVTLDLGPHWVLAYDPSISFYSSKNFHNTFNQFISLAGGATYGDWAFGLSQSFTSSDQPNVQTAGQTGTQTYTAALNANHNFNEKWSLDVNAGVTLCFVDQSQVQIAKTNGFFAPASTNSPAAEALSDSQSYFLSSWLNYALDPRFVVSAGVASGYSDQNGGLTSSDEDFLGRIVFRPGKKLTLSVDGGVEYRQFLNFNQSDTWTPIFAASATYKLFEPTLLSLAASRSVQPSLFNSQMLDSTIVSVGVQQRLLDRLQLSLSYGYAASDYIGAQQGLPQRSDVGNTYQASLSMAFLKHGTVGTFYEYSQNSSTGKGFGYSSSQTGMTLTWAY